MNFESANTSSPAGLARPDRAVVDIGSNTVRLVVYAGPRRAPLVWLNEKVTARLGRDLAESGLIPEKAARAALDALRRFKALLEALGVSDVEVVATAASRQAKNAEDFLEAVRGIGFQPRLLSGEEEARASASGVIGAFPGAQGVVTDLGGGSLELISIEGGRTHHGVSVPLGIFQLPGMRGRGFRDFDRAVRRVLDNAGWGDPHPGPLFMVGGTWRSVARYAMVSSHHPLSDPHGLQLSADEAEAMARRLMRADPLELKEIGGISSGRAGTLADAATLLRVLLADLQPTALVFSSWGLREGLLYEKLPEIARQQDPLLAAVNAFATPRGGPIAVATSLAGWTANMAAGEGASSERLRLAATMLALAAARLEPNIRTRHALDWALHKRWIGLDMPGRARIAAALVGACDKPALPSEVLQLADEAQLREALGWGLAIRLAQRIGGGSRHALLGMRLEYEDGTLVLSSDQASADLLGEMAAADLAALAGWLGAEAELRVGAVHRTADLTVM